MKTTMAYRIPAEARRRDGERGTEIMEFSLFMMLFMVPMMLYVFINGMNLLRMIQCMEINRDINNLYIHGVDFSTYEAQSVAQRLAKGYGLQIGTSFTGQENSNASNSTSNGYVILSEVMYAGTGSCASLGASCTNKNKYVFLQRITFGYSGVQFNGTTVQSGIGNPTGATINSAGFVQNYLTDSHAVATNFAGLLQNQLTDGQVMYVVETFFASNDLGSISAYPGGGIYSRTFF